MAGLLGRIPDTVPSYRHNLEISDFPPDKASDKISTEQVYRPFPTQKHDVFLKPDKR